MSNIFKSDEDFYISNGDIYIEGEKLDKSLPSSKDIENHIKSLPYTITKKEKCWEVEKALLPPLIKPFYFLVLKNGNVPDEIIFIKTYLKKYFKWFPNNQCQIISEYDSNGQGKMYNTSGIKYRIQKTYPSLIRDLHMYSMLIELNKQYNIDEIMYSFFADYCEGRDIKVKYQGKEIYIHLSLSSFNSNKYRKRKINSRHSYEGINIECNVDRDTCQKKGKFMLFTQNDALILINKILQNK
jgi:hypothetical protein